MSINAEGGDRIKISPSTGGVSALPDTVSLFYEITESLVDPGGGDPVTGDVSITHTEEVYRLIQDALETDDEPNTTTETVSVTFELNTNGQSVRTGQFLDGTHWIEHKVGLTLEAVTPNMETIPGELDWTGHEIHAHNTIINPDFGVTYFNSDSQEFGKYRNSSDDLVVDTDVRSAVNPLDSRVASDLDPSNGFLEPVAPLTGVYDADQRWDETSTALAAGDTILKVVSTVDRVGGALVYGTGASSGMPVKTMTTLEVISSAQADAQAVTPTFRPPLVWDKRDRTNRPFFTEALDLASLTLSKDMSSLSVPDIYGTTQTSIDTSTEKALYYDVHSSPVMVYCGGLNPSQGKGPDPSIYFNAQCSSASLGINARYSSKICAAMERLTPFIFDTSQALADRRKVLRTYTQRGIDAYGSVHSCGNTVYATGGWGQHITPALIFASMNTVGTAVDSVLNYNVGNSKFPITEAAVDYTIGPQSVAAIDGGSSRYFDRRGREFDGAGKYSTFKREDQAALHSSETIDLTEYSVLVLDNSPVTDRAEFADNSSWTAEALPRIIRGESVRAALKNGEPRGDNQVLVRNNQNSLNLTALDGAVIKNGSEFFRVVRTDVVDAITGVSVASLGGNPGASIGNVPNDQKYKVWLSGKFTAAAGTISVDVSNYLQDGANPDVDIVDAIGDTMFKESAPSSYHAYNYNSLSNSFLYYMADRIADLNSTTVPAEIDFRVSRAKELMRTARNIQRFVWLDLVDKYAFSDQWYLALCLDQYQEVTGLSPASATALNGAGGSNEYITGSSFGALAASLNGEDSGKTWPTRSTLPWEAAGATILFLGADPTIHTSNSGIPFTDPSGAIVGNALGERFGWEDGSRGIGPRSQNVLSGVGDFAGLGDFQTAINAATTPKMALMPFGADGAIAEYSLSGSGFDTKDRCIWEGTDFLSTQMNNYYAANPGAANVGSWIIYDAG